LASTCNFECLFSPLKRKWRKNHPFESLPSEEEYLDEGVEFGINMLLLMPFFSAAAKVALHSAH
jgi:hypothetical protein